MKKLAMSLTLFIALAWPLAGFADNSGPAGNPVELLTGEVWQASKPETKLAWLFGVDSAVAVENAVFEHMRQMGASKKKVVRESPFVADWIKAFGSNDTRESIAAMVDEWYAKHPDQLKRPVMDVIWYEIVVPRVSGK